MENFYDYNLTVEERLLLNSEVDRRAKNTVVAYLLLIFLGTLGAHRFYLNRNGTAVTMLLITILTFGLGVIVTGPWALIDLFLIGGYLKEDRLKIEAEVSREILYRRQYKSNY